MVCLIQLALALQSAEIWPSDRVRQVSLQCKGLGHCKLSSACCRLLTYCLWFYIHIQIFYHMLLNCALFLSLVFFLWSYHPRLHQLLCLVLTYVFSCCFHLSLGFLLSLHPLDIVFFPQYVLPCFPQHCYSHFYLSRWYSVCWVYLLSDVFLPSLCLFPVSFHPQSHTRDSRAVTGGPEDECPLTALQKLPKCWICCWQRL